MNPFHPENSDAAGDIRKAADALLAALQFHEKLPGLPGDMPAALEEAYQVQDAIVRATGPVGGWKVSPLRAGGEPRCSPIPRAFFGISPAHIESGFLSLCQGELEVAVRLGSDLSPGSGQLSLAEVADAIAAIHPAIELLSSRFAADSVAPDFHRLADLQNCAGVIIGEGVANWRSIEFADLSLDLSLDGDAHHATQPQPSTEQTLAAIGWLAMHAAGRGMPLKAGDIIITGARVGPLALTTTGKVDGHVGSLGAVTLTRR